MKTSEDFSLSGKDQAEAKEGRATLERLFTVAGVHTQKALAISLGIASVASISNAASNNQFPFKWIKTLCEQHPEFSLNWIVFGTGNQFLNSFKSDYNSQNTDAFLDTIRSKYEEVKDSVYALQSSIDKYNNNNDTISVLTNAFKSLNYADEIKKINDKIENINNDINYLKKIINSNNEKIESIFKILNRYADNQQ